jgi:CRISPR/Cas system-associated protein Csm6
MPISTAVAVLMQVSKADLVMACNELTHYHHKSESSTHQPLEKIPEYTPTSMCTEHNVTIVLQAERLAHTYSSITTGFKILMAVIYEEYSLLACNAI